MPVALAIGADAKAITSPYDGTALVKAVILGDGGTRHQRTARHLAVAGARRDLGDGSGVTPIKMARQRGYEAIVRILEKE